MKNIVVTNKQEVNLPGEKMTINTFVERASQGDGLNYDGILYIDVSVLNKELYKAIAKSSGSVEFFVTDGDEVPEFVEEKVTKVNESIGLDEIEDEIISEDAKERLTKAAIKNASSDIVNLINEHTYTKDEEKEGNKEAMTFLFGSSKGGTGKTFTCLMSAYRYAKKHPDKKIAVSDFDIADGQVGITIHKIQATMYQYYKEWRLGNNDFKTMSQYKVKYSKFPPNVDFYLAPRDANIKDENFWNSIFVNLIKNYDTVFFDSGIDYLNCKPISSLYKIADKIILVSTTSIKSLSSVRKQIDRLRGDDERTQDVFTKEHGIGDRLNLVITQAIKKDETNETVFKVFRDTGINIIGTFGYLTADIQRIEYLSEWDIWDNKPHLIQTFDKITEHD